MRTGTPIGRAMIVGALLLPIGAGFALSVNAARECTITGTKSGEHLFGTKRNDVICGRGGNDVINAHRGSDLVLAGHGDDSAVGLAGQDTLIGSRGWDFLSGGTQRDDLIGRAGDDCLYAKDGRPGDDVQGGQGRDYAGYDSGDNIRAEVRNPQACPARPTP
jgi:Ca2+-binding RTX toxin-like protein